MSDIAMKRLLVFAGNYAQALQYASEKGYQPSQFTFAADKWRIAGLDAKHFDVAMIGTWKQNTEVVEAYQYWMTRAGR